VLLRPSTVLSPESEWVIYYEFVLTAKNYIRTVTSVRREWLLDIAPNYYDISTFKKGEAKTALLRIQERMQSRQKMKAGR
jgi:pre-mRNA-splicing factor ATP-dependent RNA helicase DHX15/PRP43